MVDSVFASTLQSYVGREYGRLNSWDEVNAPMIRHWCEVHGFDNPLYTDAVAAQGSCREKIVAPAAMLQVWCMPGTNLEQYGPGSSDAKPFEVLGLIEAQGYPSTVAVNSELSFDREVQLGERLYYTTRLDSISDEKTTALGTGFFVTVIMSYFAEKPSGDERVGQQLFRVFKFKPAAQPAAAAPEVKAAPAAKRPQPGISDDTRFFWEGCAEGRLLIQRCTACQTLRHPPAPVCIDCHSFDWDTVQASGKGQLYSYVVMHYPHVPPFEYPNPIGLVELEEGVRLIAGLQGFAGKELVIGEPLTVAFETHNDGAMTLPVFRSLGGDQ